MLVRYEIYSVHKQAYIAFKRTKKKVRPLLITHEKRRRKTKCLTFTNSYLILGGHFLARYELFKYVRHLRTKPNKQALHRCTLKPFKLKFFLMRYCHLHQLPTAQHTNYRHNHYQYRECEWADCCPAPSSDHCAFQISNLVLLREIFSMVDFVWNSTFSSLTAPNNHQSLGSDHFWMIKFIRNYMKSDSVQESWSLSTASRGDSEMILDTIQPYIMSL